jgi:hypothetical protein
MRLNSGLLIFLCYVFLYVWFYLHELCVLVVLYFTVFVFTESYLYFIIWYLDLQTDFNFFIFIFVDGNLFSVCMFGIYILRRNEFFFVSRLRIMLMYVLRLYCFKHFCNNGETFCTCWWYHSDTTHAGDMTQTQDKLASKWRRIRSDTTLDG